MTQRALQGLDGDAHALIEAARSAHDPAPGVQVRVRHKLQLSLAAGAGIGGYGALAGATSGKLLAAALSVGLAGSGVWYAGQRAAFHAREAPLQSALEPSLPASALASSEPATPEPSPRLPSHGAPHGGLPAAPSHPDRSSDLAQETRVLVLVNGALQRHDGVAALSLLNDYDRHIKSHLLFAERSAARVFALCTLGNSAAAEREAKRFLRHFPSSPLASRVAASCARPAPSKPLSP